MNLARNDPLVTSYEEDLFLGNLGNIDFRPLINLWFVLQYLTKYTAKAGKGSKNIGKLFEEVVDRVLTWECEDGIKDLLRTTIMKFYIQVLGGWEYSLFKVAHVGLRLPSIL